MFLTNYIKTYLRKQSPQQKYNLYKKYVDHYNGDNNYNIKTNGELMVMKKFLPQSNIVFDVGANEGEWSTLALSINPNLDLHCFEPCQAPYEKLTSNKFPAQVKTNKLGISSKQGTSDLYLFENFSPLNSLYQRSGLEHLGLAQPKKKETIELETLDNYCSNHGITQIDFLKIDIEGHELEALKGASQLLKQGKVKVIQFEYGGTYIDARILLKDIFSLFNDLPYDLYKIYPQDLKKATMYAQNLENFQLQNWLAINKSLKT